MANTVDFFKISFKMFLLQKSRFDGFLSYTAVSDAVDEQRLIGLFLKGGSGMILKEYLSPLAGNSPLHC